MLGEEHFIVGIGSPVNVSVAVNPVLDPGESQCYPYLITFDPTGFTQFRNSATIAITNHSGHLG
ncbi:MAG TPA: hypothetical protein VF918_09770 [Anaerolineales bacterium]